MRHAATLAADPAPPDPANPDPARPDPAAADPARSEAARPESAGAGPAKAESASAAPARSASPGPQPTGPDPSAPDPAATAREAFRLAWRGFGSAVALIATEAEGQRHAMLATAVTSVSMDPPLLLICINRDSGAYEALVRRGAFTLGILGTRSHAVGRHVAATRGEARFARGDWRALRSPDAGLDGLPHVAEAQATLACRVETRHDHGTHSIFIARVEEVTPPRESDPLLYCEGRFGRFAGIAD